MVRGFITFIFLAGFLELPTLLALFLGACVWVNVNQKKKGKKQKKKERKMGRKKGRKEGSKEEKGRKQTRKKERIAFIATMVLRLKALFHPGDSSEG